MKKSRTLYLFVSIMVLLPNLVKAQEQVLWYKTPATDWTSALPIGNGRMGAMVYGIPLQDRIQLSERTSQPQRADVRRGELNVTFSTHKSYKNYKRTLDLSTATAAMSYAITDGTAFQREYMASFIDSVVVIRLTAGKKGSISCNLTLKAPFKRYKVLDGQAMLILVGTTDEADAKQGKQRFVTLVKPLATGGTCGLQKGTYTIRKADDAIIYASSLSVPATDKRSEEELIESCYRTLARAYGKDYANMKKKHVGLYRNLYDKVTLNLGRPAQTTKPTDQRIREQSTKPDQSLQALFFNFGRYLMISNVMHASVPAIPNSLWAEQLPAVVGRSTRSGIYKATETSHLSDLNAPLFGKTCTVRDASVFIRLSPSALPGGCATFSDYLWDHYQYSGDKAFLSSHFPFLQAMARMYMDTLKVNPTDTRQDIRTLFADVIAATDVLYTGLKGRFSPEKAFADSLRNLLKSRSLVEVVSSESEWPIDWGVWRLARQREGDRAVTELTTCVSQKPLRRGMGNNLLCVDPTYRFEENLSCPEGIAELLLQSHNGYIFVLPALPSSWPEGSVSGLRARGGFVVSFSWKNRRLTSLSVLSTVGGMCRIRSESILSGMGIKQAKGEIKNPLLVQLNPESDKELNQALLYDLTTEAGKTYALTVK